MLPALGIDIANCGKELRWISEHLPEIFTEKFAQSELGMVQVTPR